MTITPTSKLDIPSDHDPHHILHIAPMGASSWGDSVNLCAHRLGEIGKGTGLTIPAETVLELLAWLNTPRAVGWSHTVKRNAMSAEPRRTGRTGVTRIMMNGEGGPHRCDLTDRAVTDVALFLADWLDSRPFKVRVRNRAAESAWGSGLTRPVVDMISISPHCPECGQRRGLPRTHRQHDDGETYYVDIWANPCGHEDHYADVIKEAAARP